MAKTNDYFTCRNVFQGGNASPSSQEITRRWIQVAVQLEEKRRWKP